MGAVMSRLARTGLGHNPLPAPTSIATDKHRLPGGRDRPSPGQSSQQLTRLPGKGSPRKALVTKHYGQPHPIDYMAHYDKVRCEVHFVAGVWRPNPSSP